MDPLAVLVHGAEQAPPLIGMEWSVVRRRRRRRVRSC